MISLGIATHGARTTDAEKVLIVNRIEALAQIRSSGICCSVLQCVAVCCSVLQCAEVCCRVLQGVAGCCRMLQGVTVCCSALA